MHPGRHHLRLLHAAGQEAPRGLLRSPVGKVVDRSLCEHFPLTRQELFDVVAVHGYTPLRPGRRGPRHAAAAATSASRRSPRSWPRRPTGTSSTATRALQDTNDHFLANIQRNGTYSVVPRIPGGEITPEKLIVIGEVARDFGLYTKITGGQRIDLFGARVEQLPAIWRRLVDAGLRVRPRLRQGAAHGEVLRRLDLVPLRRAGLGRPGDRPGAALPRPALAAQAQGRRRGCARECAEARGKDFGVIATEKGWNLYVGGNGGATPAHAELLAGDLDTETLVRYIDRFLMFYIRTADRLQRTAPWIERSTAGSTGSREVIVDDALGLGAELEAAMARHVDALLRRVGGDPRRPGEAGAASSPSSTPRTSPTRTSPSATSAARPCPRTPPARCRWARRSRWERRDDRPRPVSTRSPTSRHPVCRLDEIEVEGGVAALVDGAAVAIFRTHDGQRLRDRQLRPFLRASVLARGIVGHHAEGDVPFVASPMHKQAFDLRTGQCLDDAAVRVPTYDVRVRRRPRARRSTVRRARRWRAE